VITRFAERTSAGILRLVRRLHRADFQYLLPALAALPIPIGHALSACRGQFNSLTGRDWRSIALGFRHIAQQSALGYRALSLEASTTQVRRWCRQRFVAEARDEFEGRLAAAHRLGELSCEFTPPDTLARLRAGGRGLVLLTPHYQSFFAGIAFLARSGRTVNAMSSAVTRDPRVDPAVQEHFDAKYRGLEHYLNGGKVVDHELGVRPFYRMLERREVLVILADAPVLSGSGASMEVDFLGAKRVLAGGPLRLAQRTGSDVGCYVCRHLGGTRYQLELGGIAPADDPAAMARAYQFFSVAIAADPGGWWAADLLPSMPVVNETANATA
jgi:lauroyl/myristoyl acyltransferase